MLVPKIDGSMNAHGCSLGLKHHVKNKLKLKRRKAENLLKTVC
jgi:hypothetical protein